MLVLALEIRGEADRSTRGRGGIHELEAGLGLRAVSSLAASWAKRRAVFSIGRRMSGLLIALARSPSGYAIAGHAVAAVESSASDSSRSGIARDRTHAHRGASMQYCARRIPVWSRPNQANDCAGGRRRTACRLWRAGHRALRRRSVDTINPKGVPNLYESGTPFLHWLAKSSR